jgi:alpha-L-rhamnosidase
VRIAPQPGGDLTSASAAIDTEYGIASVGWSIEGPSLTLDVVLPAGTTGHVAVPAGWASELPLPTLGSGPHRIRLTRES